MLFKVAHTGPTPMAKDANGVRSVIVVQLEFEVLGADRQPGADSIISAFLSRSRINPKQVQAARIAAVQKSLASHHKTPPFFRPSSLNSNSLR